MNVPTTTSWSEINTFRQCPHKHKLSYKDRWQPPTLSKPLEYGLAWHEILENHYAGLMAEGAPKIEVILGLLHQNGAKDENHPRHWLGSIMLWMYHGYREWAKTLDWEWKIHQVEHAFQVPLPGTTTELVGRVDLMVEFKRHLWVVDHKAVGNLPTNKELDLDDQTPLYIWAARQAGYDVRGAILSHSRYTKLKRPMEPHERFSRELIYRTDEELEMVVREAVASFNSAYHPDQTSPRHPDTQLCKWRCAFLDPCLGGRKEGHLEQQILEARRFTKREPRLFIVK